MMCSEPNPASEVEQDPKLLAISTVQKPIGVPLCAASISRGFLQDLERDFPLHKKRALSRLPTQSSHVVASESDCEDQEDLIFLYSDNDDLNSRAEDKGKGKESLENRSVFFIQPLYQGWFELQASYLPDTAVRYLLDRSRILCLVLWISLHFLCWILLHTQLPWQPIRSIVPSKRL